MKEYKKILHSCGAGGIKCPCCRPSKKRNKKDRAYSRLIRRKIKNLKNDE